MGGGKFGVEKLPVDPMGLALGVDVLGAVNIGVTVKPVSIVVVIISEGHHDCIFSASSDLDFVSREKDFVIFSVAFVAAIVGRAPVLAIECENGEFLACVLKENLILRKF
jgi:hypothetical protein